MPSFAANSSRFRLIPILLAQAFGVACGVAGVKVNSHLIPPDVLGVYGVFLTLAPIGAWVVHAGLVKFVSRHWAGAVSRPALLRDAVAIWAQRLPWLALAACAGALAIVQLAPGTSLLVLATTLFGAAALLAATALGQSALQAERAHWRDCALSAAGSATRTFVPPLLFFSTTGTFAALACGFGIHAVITAVVAAFVMGGYWRAADAPRARARLDLGSTYGGPMFVSLAAVGWLLAGMNRWIIAAFFGETEAGYFTLAGGAALVISSTLGAVFVQYFQPGFFVLADTPGIDRRTLARRVDIAAGAYALLAIVGVGALALIGPWLVGPLISESYRISLIWILPSGCFGVAIITMVFYQSLLLAGRRERGCAPVEFSGAAVLTIGCVTTAAFGRDWFERWLMATPLVPWLVTRPMARVYFFMPDAGATRAPAQ